MHRMRTFSGPQSLEQGGEHFLDLDEFAFSFLVSADVQHFKITSEQKKILEFARRTHGNMQKLSKLRSTPSSTAFSNVRWYGTGCAAYLTAEAKSFVGRKFAGEPVRLEGQSMTPAPNVKFTKILHGGASPDDTCLLAYYLQLTTNDCQLFDGCPYAD
jgi:hypothetical protein